MAQTVVTNTPTAKTVGDPVAAYENMQPVWKRNKAIMNGQEAARAHDRHVDGSTYKNLLIPFSPFMSQQQYDFYKAEGELPGLVAQYGRTLVSGLLRKRPQFTLPSPVEKNEDIRNWIVNSIGAENSSLTSLLDEALWEEMQTSRAWLMVDFPSTEGLLEDEIKLLRPYIVTVRGENVINWRRGTNNQLVKLTLRFYEEQPTADDLHVELVDTVMDYRIKNSILQVDKYAKKKTSDSIDVVAGRINVSYKATNDEWTLVSTTYPQSHGESLTYIPARPINGNVDVQEPFMQNLIDREISLYNKISRRNHLLYGAATYTPYVSSDMDDDKFKAIVGGGLGSWIHIGADDKIGVLETPTDALKDMETAIASTIGEMARMGIRMLTPDNAPQESGVALEIKNAAQTSQLGLLNTKVSNTMEVVLCMALGWHLGINPKELEKTMSFVLSQDFNPTPLGADWLRLVTEWYESGKIPRSIWLDICKQNDILPGDYDDDAGKIEIQSDDMLNLGPTKIDVSV